ncbi:MAG: DUF6261 family protein [Ignavibacteria bacterium]|jgi:uncharacterized spore protein YtfJ
MSVLNKLIVSCRTTEINGTANRIIIKFDEGDWSSDTHLTGIFTQLKIAKEALTTAINRSKAQSNLDEKDEIRDSKVRGIHYLLQGYLYYPDEEIKTAAENVDEVFNRYGVEIVKDSYVTESSLINSMLEDLSTAEMQTETAKLPGLANLITELSTAQQEFETARVEFESEQAEEGTEENATELKKEAALIINEQLIVYLRAMQQVDEETYGSFARAVGQIVNDTNEEVKKRRKNSEPEQENA